MKKRGQWLLGIFLGLCSLLAIVPFYVMLIMSTHKSEEIFSGGVLLPGNYMLQNFQTVFQNDYLRFYWNSFYISISATLLSVLSSALVGFALSKYQFRFRKLIHGFILATLMIPWQVGMVGYVMQLRFMGLMNHHLPLILPWIANSFGAFWMTQYIGSSVNGEIIESARIDGCPEPRIFTQIVLPMITPAVASLCMLVFLWTWNNYLMPVLLLTDTRLYTIPLCIASLGNFYRVDYGARMAGLALAVLPLIILFVLGSKAFIRGLAVGAVKE